MSEVFVMKTKKSSIFFEKNDCDMHFFAIVGQKKHLLKESIPK
jgi:hypothetical protein